MVTANISVVGCQHREESVRKMCENDKFWYRLSFMFDTTNAYDSNAIAVVYSGDDSLGGDTIIGYVPKGDQQAWVREQICAGEYLTFKGLVDARWHSNDCLQWFVVEVEGCNYGD